MDRRAKIVALALTLWPSACLGWRPPLNVTRLGPGADAGHVAMAVDSAGGVHMLIGRSGSTWTISVKDDIRSPLTLFGQGNGHALCGDANGKIHAVWSEGWEIRYRVWSEGAWGGTGTVSNGSGDSLNPNVAVDSGGNVHVVWAKGGNVWYNRRSSQSGQWDGASQITTEGDLQGYYPPRIACAGTAPLVTFGRKPGGAWQAWFATRESGSWTKQEISSGAGASNGDISVSPDGTVDVCWDQNYDVYHRRRLNGVWQSIELVNADGLVPRVSTVSASGMDVIWGDSAPGFSDVYGSHFGGSVWSAAASVTGLQGGVSSEIDHDASGRQYAVWSNDWDIWYTDNAPTDITAPPAASGMQALAGDSQTRLQWVNPEALDLARARLLVRTDRFPLSPSDGTVLFDRTAAPGTDSFTHTGLTNGAHYYYALFLYDSASNVSPPSPSDAIPRQLSCGSVKQAPDGTAVNLNSKVVTALFPTDGALYVEEPDRSAGIRVQASTTGLNLIPGDFVNISGVLGTRILSAHPAERQIVGSVVRPQPTPAPLNLQPLGMNMQAVGGETSGLAPGVEGAAGINNIGLLVTLTGRVSARISSSVFVDDGSGIIDPAGYPGVLVKCPNAAPPVAAGDMVKVTGIVEGSIQAGHILNRRQVRIRSYADLLKLN